MTENHAVGESDAGPQGRRGTGRAAQTPRLPAGSRSERGSQARSAARAVAGKWPYGLGAALILWLSAMPVPGNERSVEQVRDEFIDLSRKLHGLPAGAEPKERDGLQWQLDIRRQQLRDNGYTPESIDALEQVSVSIALPASPPPRVGTGAPIARVAGAALSAARPGAGGAGWLRVDLASKDHQRSQRS